MSSFQPTPTILLPHLPAKTLVGLDLLSFTSPEQFYGISDLSQGWHFLYTGTTENFSLRCGAWFYVGDIRQVESARSQPNDDATAQEIVKSQSREPAEIRIWKWNPEVEAILPLMSDTDSNKLEIMRWKANLGGLRQMGALFSYKSAATHDADQETETASFPKQKDWARLTSHLSPQILSRILGEAHWDDDGRPSWTVTSANSAARDAEVIPGVTAQESSEEAGEFGNSEKTEKELRFLPVDLKRTWREGAIGRERTEAAQDRSWALGDLIDQSSSSSKPSAGQKTGESHILGELQFCFLMILTLMNYSCLEQWKRLLGLIFTCRSAIRERESFFRDVLQLLLLQLRHCEDVVGGLFEMDGDYDANFLRKLLTNFRQLMEEALEGHDSLVKRDMDALEKWVRENYGWELRKGSIMRRGLVQLEDGEEVELAMIGADEDDESGEYAPVVVDTGEGDHTGLNEDHDIDTPVN
jgi:A1 cistron-splicing factor AAR2